MELQKPTTLVNATKLKRAGLFQQTEVNKTFQYLGLCKLLSYNACNFFYTYIYIFGLDNVTKNVGFIYFFVHFFLPFSEVQLKLSCWKN